MWIRWDKQGQIIGIQLLPALLSVQLLNCNTILSLSWVSEIESTQLTWRTIASYINCVRCQGGSINVVGDRLNYAIALHSADNLNSFFSYSPWSDKVLSACKYCFFPAYLSLPPLLFSNLSLSIILCTEIQVLAEYF